jgi:hypothetical protein
MLFNNSEFGCLNHYWILLTYESKLAYYQEMLGKILIKSYFKPILIPFWIESSFCRNISDSSSQSVSKLIMQVKSLIFKIFKIAKIVPGSVPSTVNESYRSRRQIGEF